MTKTNKILTTTILLLLTALFFTCKRTAPAPTINTSKLDSITFVKDAQIEFGNIAIANLKRERKSDSIAKAKLLSQLLLIRNNTTKLVSKAKAFTSDEQADFYNNRYSLPNNAKKTANGTELSRTMVGINIEDLIDCDGTRLEYDKLKQILKITESNIKKCDSIGAIKDLQLIATNDKLKASNEAVKELSKSVKKQVFRLYAGGSIGSDKQLGKIVYSGGVMLQNAKMNLLMFDYLKLGSESYAMVGVRFSIFGVNK